MGSNTILIVQRRFYHHGDARMLSDTTTHGLTPQRAFVVHFTAGTRIEIGQIAGRVEHVISRQAATFTSLDTLLDFITLTLMDQLNTPHTDAY